jgi:hypothetical protein
VHPPIEPPEALILENVASPVFFSDQFLAEIPLLLIVQPPIVPLVIFIFVALT